MIYSGPTSVGERKGAAVRNRATVDTSDRLELIGCGWLGVGVRTKLWGRRACSIGIRMRCRGPERAQGREMHGAVVGNGGRL